MSLSICTPQVGREMLSIENNKPVGYASSTVLFILQVFETQFKNCTVHLTDSFGDIVDQEEQRYDGCIGELQKGRLDIAMMPGTYPTIAPNISSTRTFMSSTTTIFSTYNNSFEHSMTDVTDAFASFHHSVWLLILVTLVTLFCVLTTDVTAKRRSGISRLRLLITILVGAALKQFSSLTNCSRRFTARLTLLIAIVFVFQVQLFFSSMIKTEMVVQQKPDTISTYEEVLQHPDSNPLWFKTESIHWEFEKAQRDSAAGKIWQKAMKIGIDKCLVDLEYNTLFSMLRKVATKERVMFLPGFATKPTATNICAFTRAQSIMTDVNMWFKTDPSANERLMVYLRSSNTSRETSDKLDILTERIIEHALGEELMRKSGSVIMKNTGKPEVAECLENRVIYPKHELVSLNLFHFIGVWKILLLGFAVIFTGFVVESKSHTIFKFLARIFYNLM